MVQHHRYCNINLGQTCDCPARSRKFGDVGEALLQERFRVLYWENNSAQVATGHDSVYHRAQMDKIVEILGYTPEA